MVFGCRVFDSELDSEDTMVRRPQGLILILILFSDASAHTTTRHDYHTSLRLLKNNREAHFYGLAQEGKNISTLLLNFLNIDLITTLPASVPQSSTITIVSSYPTGQTLRNSAQLYVSAQMSSKN